MGNVSSKKKRKSDNSYLMETRRNFGSPSGQIANREPLTPNLFMKVGTRVGVITAYYQHVPSTVTLTSTTNTSTPVVRSPVVNVIPELENSAPLSNPVIYDVPRTIQ